jgi:hypothetical protein
VEKLGMKGVHFHDLRHAGNVWAAQTRVSTRDLMARMGMTTNVLRLSTSGPRRKRAARIAEGLSDLADQRRDRAGDDRPGGSLRATPLKPAEHPRSEDADLPP